MGEKITIDEFLEEMGTDRTSSAYGRDACHLEAANVVILLLPCGISAHIEAAYAAGQLKYVFVTSTDMMIEPELMYGLLGGRYMSIDQIIDWICTEVYPCTGCPTCHGKPGYGWH